MKRKTSQLETSRKQETSQLEASGKRVSGMDTSFVIREFVLMLVGLVLGFGFGVCFWFLVFGFGFGVGCLVGC